MNWKIVLYFTLALLLMTPALAHHGDLEGLGFLFVLEIPFLIAFFIIGLILSLKRLAKANWGAKYNRRLLFFGILLAILPIGLLFPMFSEFGPNILEIISQMYLIFLADLLLLYQIILLYLPTIKVRKELVRKLNIGFIGLFIIMAMVFLIALIREIIIFY